jgi:hypothetical protein
METYTNKEIAKAPSGYYWCGRKPSDDDTDKSNGR